MAKFSWRKHLTVQLVLVLLGVLGCGVLDNVTVVTGKVTYKDKPLTGGTVTFHYKDGTSNQSEIQTDGGYVLAKIATGEVTVVVDNQAMVKAQADESKAPPLPPGMKDAPPADTVPKSKYAGLPKAELVPAKYRDKATSPLKYTVKSGKQDFQIQVTP